MSGICGFTGGLDNKQYVLKGMLDCIRHRGPDGEGQFLDSDIAMGIRVLELCAKKTGDQPVLNEDASLVCSCDGEIYNADELRKELQGIGHRFCSALDTEVILHGYEEWGERILYRLRGSFAFAIWDCGRRELFAARDMFGIRPLYYRLESGRLIYGSEIRTLLVFPGYEKRLNEEALQMYLSFQYSVLSETFYSGIYRLRPGHFFRWKDGRMKVTCYFRPSLEPDQGRPDHAGVVNAIDLAVKDAVCCQTDDEIQMGAFLSGGVDSAYVTCLSGVKHSFSVGFDQEGFNEIPARAVFRGRQTFAMKAI